MRALRDRAWPYACRGLMMDEVQNVICKFFYRATFFYAQAGFARRYVLVTLVRRIFVVDNHPMYGSPRFLFRVDD